MKPVAWSLLAAITLLPAFASAQEDDDAPIPYGDEEYETPRDERGLRELPSDSFETAPDLREESEYVEEEVNYSRLDDPNLGLGAELLAGTLLLDSARGQWAEPRFAWGVRANWEFGRLFTDETLHEALFVDLAWAYGAIRDGTERIFVDTHYHYFSVAPAYELHVGRTRTYAFYGQVGGGFAYQLTGVHHDGSETTIAGLKPVLQYGVGFRGRPKLGGEDDNLHLVFRVELTRFRRGYMDDTLLAASVGASF